MVEHTLQQGQSVRHMRWWHRFWWLALGLVLLTAWGYRSLGRNWDETYGLHPDERFLTMVLTAIEPVDSLAEYFDTQRSSLNPANRGLGFFVYGTLPVFLIRYAAEALNRTGYGQVMLLSRAFSALMDLGTLILVAWLGRRLLGLRAGMLAAALYAFSVMPIQQSHFGTVDNFLVFFLTLSLALAVEIQHQPRTDGRSWPWFLGFGLAFGAAMASKLSALPAALLLPGALAARWLQHPHRWRQELTWALRWTLLAAVTSFLFFRVAQPYAFTGPYPWNLSLHPEWLANLNALRAQASGQADFPPSIQWARRPITYGLENYVRWGAGPALALLAWAGALALLWPWRRTADLRLGLVWLWGVGYFVWQSSLWNPTMRYFLPAYPPLTLLAVWAVERLLSHPRTRWRLLGRGLALVTLLATAAWAWAFVQIYARPHTRIAASRWLFRNLPGPVNLELRTPQGPFLQPLPLPGSPTWTAQAPLVLPFQPRASGSLEAVTLYRVEHLSPEPRQVTATVELRPITAGDQDPPLAQAQTLLPLPQDPRKPPQPVRFTFPKPVNLQAGETYLLTLKVEAEAFLVRGAVVANESSWDDGLPLRIDGFDPFGGLYQGLTFEMYWDDTPDKLQRFLDILDRADVILITSSRQWGSLPRLPERYPLVIEYYYALTGCPRTQPLEPCFNRLQPGMYQGDLGFALVAVFQSDPTLGPWRINDQAADEAFTVYDHPKVLVFRKTQDYDPQRVRKRLSVVDFRLVQRVLPGEAPTHPVNLLLPPDRWARARQEGTWRELFPPNNPLNRSQVLALGAWYLFISLLGWAAWLLLHPVLQGFYHRGYPWIRIAGMLLWAWLAWFASAWGIPVTPGTLWLWFALLVSLALTVAWRWQRDWWTWLRASWRLVLRWEAWFLGFFAFDLFLRVMNPDLWHPARGGERPMELSYLHAILRSTTFPPYDPWFAGGYMNYYYWGFVLVGLPMKALGLRTEVAFNLAMPTLFAATGVGVMALVAVVYRSVAYWSSQRLTEGVALLGGLLAVVLGNLGTVQMFWEGFQKLGAGRPIEGLTFLERWWYALIGMGLWVRGAQLPYHLGEWYWNPSRIIPGQGDVPPITEFPFFSFLYGDLHPHLIAFAVTVLAMVWAWVVVHYKYEVLQPRVVWYTLFWGGLVIGSLRPLNTWDFPTYFLLGSLALGYGLWHREAGQILWKRVVRVLLGLTALWVFTRLLWNPYLDWYVQGYTKVDPWRGPKTPITAYLWHWGFLLFLLATAGMWVLVRWMKTAPALTVLLWWKRQGRAYQAFLLTLAASGLLLGLVWKVSVTLIALPLLLLMTGLVLLPHLPEGVRFAALLAATALGLTLLVESVVIRGDIGRMNMVFKFYLQAWLLFSVAAAAFTGWLWTAGLPRWRAWAQHAWMAGFVLLGISSLAYTILASSAKIRDRWVPEAPRGLDGLAFLPRAVYHDQGQALPLQEDFQAIQWLRQEVEGSPVIVEANTPEYRMGNRITWFTGLPGVVGWSWHQRQQRGVVTPPEWVTQRVGEIAQFYTTTDRAWVEDFLRRYRVSYIILGPLERVYYAGPGLAKFEQWAGDLWDPVYRTSGMVIYRVRSLAVFGTDEIP